MTETRENVDVLREGLKDFDSLPPELAGKFNSLIVGFVCCYRDSFRFVSEQPNFARSVQNFRKKFFAIPRNAGGRQWWQQSKTLFPVTGVEYVEDALVKCEVEPITETWGFLATTP